MLLRIFFIALVLGMILRFFGRIFRTILMRPPSTAGTPKKSSHNIDDSQIQDADFKDL